MSRRCHLKDHCVVALDTDQDSVQLMGLNSALACLDSSQSPQILRDNLDENEPDSSLRVSRVQLSDASKGYFARSSCAVRCLKNKNNFILFSIDNLNIHFLFSHSSWITQVSVLKSRSSILPTSFRKLVLVLHERRAP